MSLLKRIAQSLKERIPGGLSSGKSPEDFESSALQDGIAVEKEHTQSPAIAQEIAMDHLAEDPKYYEKLAKMEKKGQAEEDFPIMPNASEIASRMEAFREYLASDSVQKTLKRGTDKMAEGDWLLDDVEKLLVDLGYMADMLRYSANE